MDCLPLPESQTKSTLPKMLCMPPSTQIWLMEVIEMLWEKQNDLMETLLELSTTVNSVTNKTERAGSKMDK